MWTFWPTEIFDTFEKLVEYCKGRYPDNFQKVIDEKKAWRIYADRFQIDHTAADKFYWSKTKFDEYYDSKEFLSDIINHFPNRHNEIWTRVYH